MFPEADYIIVGQGVNEHLLGMMFTSGPSLGWVFLLLILFQVKHFLADYLLQPTSMAAKKYLPGWDFVPGLLQHVGVHGALTGFLCLLWGTPFLLLIRLCLVDMIVHFVMDRVKASPQYLGRYKAVSGKEYVAAMKNLDHPSVEHFRREAKAQLDSNTRFWWALGFDQMVHHLTHYYLAYRMLMG